MTTNRAAPIALVVLLVLGVVAVVLAGRTDPDDVPAPRSTAVATAADLPVEAPSAPPVIPEGWLNSDDIDPGALAGKVVLYEFWTFGCSNCQAVLPHMKAWHERYGPEGLVVLSIHTPEFDHEADPAAVAEFVEAEGIRYPVALDPDKAIWRSFENRYWPAFYLHDEQGRRRLTHFGEGRYEETEDAIRALLGVGPEVPRVEVR